MERLNLMARDTTPPAIALATNHARHCRFGVGALATPLMSPKLGKVQDHP